MKDSSKIMVVDDEPNIAEVVRLYLEHSGYEAVILHRGQDVIEVVRTQQPRLVVLDIMLPDVNGYEICEGIRKLDGPAAQTPVIFLSAKGEGIDKLRAFNLGSDDYVVKPFDPNELMARIKAVLRRARLTEPDTAEKPKPPAKMLCAANICVDMEQFKVTVDGNRVDLTLKEMELLNFFIKHAGRVFSREDLLGYVWNFDFIGGTRTVDAHVKNLRRKLGAHPQWTIQTLWGIGYSLEVHDI
ncbi:response regulator transcription factor [Paenibacillus sp. GP183]|jgi:DNA-binding response OmpR family regulator|uniref:response regulator transcription factor n=1 Tax=Paenibacillus sp. GP183 TaxID=1882751 RepID=UPI000894C0E2|nr:response regulator transcription factor [Paenibacillus sp. GP183]SEB60425.1 DNA-binding response regulator, OmpR family, contains REC and winged-helix (wHTH) domain [Paenibacillus sp. GP183]